jgi:hypothetical protein
MIVNDSLVIKSFEEIYNEADQQIKYKRESSIY